MDEPISRQAAIEMALEYFAEYLDGAFNENGKKELIARFQRLPSAQTEIITCIDCIHYTPLGKDKTWGRCSVHSSPTENQRMCQSCDFCAWAERRTDG